MVNPKQAVRAVVFGLWLSIFSLASASYALGQDFTLTPSALKPSAVDPGVSAGATISVQPKTAMTNPTVSLSCTVSPVETNGPVCTPSSDSVVAPATAALTVTTSGLTPELSNYVITFTGTDASGSQSVNFTLAVEAVVGEYTLTVTSQLNPSSLHAGSGATGVITLTPLNGYGGHTITLSCSMVTPPVIPSPQCSFSPATVSVVTSSASQTSAITITTSGPAAQLRSPRIFYAVWFLLPGVALAGLGSAGGRRKKLLGWLLLLTLAAVILLIPACGGSPTTTTTTTSIGGISGTTPNNTYTFTLSGADENGLAPSNITTAPTVSLTVD
jgi:hypothetical protein